MGRRGKKRKGQNGFGRLDGDLYGFRRSSDGTGYVRDHNADEPVGIGGAKKIIHGSWEKDGHGPVNILPKPDYPLGGSYPQTAGWSTGEEPMDLCAKDCSWIEKQNMPKISVLLKRRVGDAVRYLLDTVPIEWQILLIGDVVVENGHETVIATDYYIPKQEVGPAHVRNVDCIDKKFIAEKKIVGTMHSHVQMGAFFSGTDMRECNSSPILYHIVINVKFEYEAVKQVALPCGMRRFEKMKIAFEVDPLPKPEGFDNIAQGGPTGSPTYNAGWSVPPKPGTALTIVDKRGNVQHPTEGGIANELWD